MNQLAVIAATGIFDAGGNILFAVATRLGRLDISATVASLYPAGTVILAWIILNEKLSSRQWFGVLTALAALTLIAWR
jgi:drug/metabolite transporter (DMT)-like permease